MDEEPAGSLELDVSATGSGDSGVLRDELVAFLELRDPGSFRFQRVPKRGEMGVGSVLVAVLGTKAVVLLAAGIADWLRKRNTLEGLEISIGDVNINAEFAHGAGVEAITQMLQDSLNQGRNQ